MAKKKPRPQPVPAPGLDHLIDAHTHLASCGARDDASVAQVMRRAFDAGVHAVCTVGDGIEESELALAAAQSHPRVFAACAIHPTRARELDAQTREVLTRLVAHPRCVAVGETGMDRYWLTHAPDTTASVEAQEEAFRWHIDLAVANHKAVMIHNREADADVLRILADSPAPPAVMLHCFSSGLSVADEAINRGYYISFAGNVTFKRNDALREAARAVPLERLLIETDAPYMTPEPFRGARNEPALIGHTAACLARVRNMDVSELAAAVTENFERIYGVTVE